MCAKLLQSCPTLQPYGPCRAPLSMGFSRQEYWSGLPFPSPGDLPDPGIKSVSSSAACAASRFFATEPLEKPPPFRLLPVNPEVWHYFMDVVRLFCNSMGCSLPGSSVHGIFQARILDWVAKLSSRRSSRPRDRTHITLPLQHWQVSSLPLEPPWKPLLYSTQNYIQYPMLNYNGKEYEKTMCICIMESLYCTVEFNTTL